MIALLTLAAAHLDPDALRCRAGRDRIDISLPGSTDKRIVSMAVVRGQRWAFLVEDQNRFALFHPGVRKLTLHPSRQLGLVDGRTVRAFPRAGSYRIVFADNLETEPENMISLDCVVRVR